MLWLTLMAMDPEHIIKGVHHTKICGNAEEEMEVGVDLGLQMGESNKKVLEQR